MRRIDQLRAEVAFRKHATASGQVSCSPGVDGVHDWWLPDTGCPWCKAVV